MRVAERYSELKREDHKPSIVLSKAEMTPMEKVERDLGVEVVYNTPRGETPMQANGIKARLAYFAQFEELIVRADTFSVYGPVPCCISRVPIERHEANRECTTVRPSISSCSRS